MKLTKSKLKQIIKEQLKEVYAADEEEVREWHDMIERDALALRETISNAHEAMGILQDYSELPQLLELLDQALGALGKPHEGYGD